MLKTEHPAIRRCRSVHTATMTNKGRENKSICLSALPSLSIRIKVVPVCHSSKGFTVIIDVAPPMTSFPQFIVSVYCTFQLQITFLVLRRIKKKKKEIGPAYDNRSCLVYVQAECAVTDEWHWNLFLLRLATPRPFRLRLGLHKNPW